MVFSVTWPATGRLIPNDTNRIVFYVSGPDMREPRAAILNRTPAASTASLAMNDVPTGPVRWISAEARQVANLPADAPEQVQHPATDQLAEGQVLSAGRLVGTVGLFPGLELPVSITLDPPASPGPQVTDVNLDIHQVLPDAFPMVLLLELFRDQEGNPLTNLNAANFTLTETLDGDTKTAPITDVRTAVEAEQVMRAVLVLDRSGSMSGSRLTSLKSAARTFVNLLGANDEVAVVSFDDSIRVVQSFTSNKTALRAAIDGLATVGTTALWDATSEGLRLATNAGGRAAVIAMTDGEDNASSISLSSLTSQARAAALPIFTIGLGVSSSYATNLRNLATATGGLYTSSPSAAELERIYRSIGQQLNGQMKISFISPFLYASANTRTLRLSYRYGSYSNTATKTYVFNGAVDNSPLINLSGYGVIENSDFAMTSLSARKADLIVFTATRTGRVEVMMYRTDIPGNSTGPVGDPYLVVRDSADREIAENDDEGGSTNARLIFTAQRNQQYTVYFTTYGTTDRGDYGYVIREIDGNSRQEPLLSGDPAARLFLLPAKEAAVSN